MIEIIKSLEGRIAALEESAKNILRVGTVVTRDADRCRVRVQFRDNDQLVSWWCQVLVGKAHLDKHYWLPDVGEMVTCAFLPFGHEQGFVLGSAYNTVDRPPDDANADRWLIETGTGVEILVDRKCGLIRLRAGMVHIMGTLVVHGMIYDHLGSITDHRNRGLPRDPGANPPRWMCEP